MIVNENVLLSNIHLFFYLVSWESKRASWLKLTVAYLEPSRKSTMEIFRESSQYRLDSEYTPH